MTTVLGVSGLFHDAAAAVVRDGVVVAAAQEERFTRRKHEARLPASAIAAVLDTAGVAAGGLDEVVFYEKPVASFARFVDTLGEVAPRGFAQLRRGVPPWIRSKLWVGSSIASIVADLGHDPGPVRYTEHHQAHAASAFFPSPFERAAVVVLDGVGEWATASIGRGGPDGVELLAQLWFPDSLGLLYSMFTEYCGFEANSGEYELMGLAPYGSPTYQDLILTELVDLRDDGSFAIDHRYAGYRSGTTMTNRRFARAFGGPARRGDEPVTRRHADLAASVQAVTEQVVLRISEQAHHLTGERHLCLAGGVALNAVANGRVRRDGPFDDVWVQPAAGDAGGAIGAALEVAHQLGAPRRLGERPDGMSGCLLGPDVTESDIAAALAASGHHAERLEPQQRAERVAALLADGAVVGVCDGRMEFGPRALGNRSILADPRSATAQATINERVKHRQTFRPFAPSVLAERAGEWFDAVRPSPYMTFVEPLSERHWMPVDDTDAAPGLDPADRIGLVRSTVPAITHVDRSARLQTVDATTSPRFHELIAAFDRLTGCPLVLNTSLNVRGEPIACTPADALHVLDTAGLDHLVLGDHLVAGGAR